MLNKLKTLKQDKLDFGETNIKSESGKIKYGRYILLVSLN